MEETSFQNLGQLDLVERTEHKWPKERSPELWVMIEIRRGSTLLYLRNLTAKPLRGRERV